MESKFSDVDEALKVLLGHMRLVLLDHGACGVKSSSATDGDFLVPSLDEFLQPELFPFELEPKVRSTHDRSPQKYTYTAYSFVLGFAQVI